MSSNQAVAVLITGLPGSGKTYFAKHFAPAINAAYFSSDIMRKSKATDHTYSIAEKHHVYAALLERMEHSLRAGQTVVIDATFFLDSLREEFNKVAKNTDSKVRWIEVRANKSVIRDRLSKPREDSEADYGVYLKLRDQYQPLKERHLVLHSDKYTLNEMINKAKDWLGEEI